MAKKTKQRGPLRHGTPEYEKWLKKDRKREDAAVAAAKREERERQAAAEAAANADEASE